MSRSQDQSVANRTQPANVADRLQRLIKSERGAGARVINFAVMEDGHAGLTFGFEVVDAAGAPLGAYVLKMAPIGVVRRGNTDVYRQAPLQRALKKFGLPVPEIPWASPDEDQLGTPFLVMERMPGRVFLVWEPHEIVLPRAGTASGYLDAGSRAAGAGSYS